MKWLSRIILAGLILFAALGAITWFMNKSTQPPEIKDAPWVIQTYSVDEFRTPSRVYYAKTVFMLDDGTPVITDYWHNDGQRFHFKEGEKAFPFDMYGNVGLRMRKGL